MLLVSMILEAKGRDVMTVVSGTTVADALEIMTEKNIGAVLVMEKGKPIGIFSERDFVHEVARNHSLLLNMPVDSYMTRDLYCVSPSESIEECMALMTNKHIRHLPVMQAEDLVGLISIGDVVKNVIEDKNLLIDNLEKFIFGR